MRLFKFRSLSNIEFVLDIIYNQRLYCATYDNLNDPFEGLFISNLLNLSERPMGSELLGHSEAGYQVVVSAKQIHNQALESSRICSLSRAINDVRLWSYYGDGHTGIAIEIEVDKDDPYVFPVKYCSELPRVNLKKLYDNDVLSLLRQKTLHWQHEQEYRVVSSDKYYCIKHKIRAIYLGSRVSAFHADILKKAVGKDVDIFHTQINPHTVEVEKY
jgi:hypothetical protein